VLAHAYLVVAWVREDIAQEVGLDLLLRAVGASVDGRGLSDALSARAFVLEALLEAHLPVEALGLVLVAPGRLEPLEDSLSRHVLVHVAVGDWVEDADGDNPRVGPVVALLLLGVKPPALEHGLLCEKLNNLVG
jgi:hypothetical protein